VNRFEGVAQGQFYCSFLLASCGKEGASVIVPLGVFRDGDTESVIAKCISLISDQSTEAPSIMYYSPTFFTRIPPYSRRGYSDCIIFAFGSI
jgi:hypothetical protein